MTPSSCGLQRFLVVLQGFLCCPGLFFLILRVSFKTVGSDLEGTGADDLDLLGSNTRVVLTKKDFFSEELSLGLAGMLMTVRGKMTPWKRSIKPK